MKNARQNSVRLRGVSIGEVYSHGVKFSTRDGLCNRALSPGWQCLQGVFGGLATRGRCQDPALPKMHASATLRPAEKHGNNGGTLVPDKGSFGLVRVALGCGMAATALAFWATAITGASVLLAVSIHGLVYVSSLMLLMYGCRPGRTSPTDVTFWSFVVGGLMHALGAGVAIQDGAQRLAEPLVMTDTRIAAVAVGIAAVLALVPAWQAGAFQQCNAGWRRLFTAGNAADLLVATVGLSSIALTAGHLIAAVAVTATSTLGHPGTDGLGALAIGLVMALAAVLMALRIRPHLAVPDMRPTEELQPPVEPQPVLAPSAIQATNTRRPANPKTAGRKKGGKRR